MKSAVLGACAAEMVGGGGGVSGVEAPLVSESGAFADAETGGGTHASSRCVSGGAAGAKPEEAASESADSCDMAAVLEECAADAKGSKDRNTEEDACATEEFSGSGAAERPRGKLSAADLDFDDLSLSDAASEEDTLSTVSGDSDASDVFHVSSLPPNLRTWQTEEDRDLERIRSLATALRSKPLLPLKPNSSVQVHSIVNSGICLPFAHCAFQGCTWCCAEKSAEKPLSHLAELQDHLTKRHCDLFRAHLGPETLPSDWLDYYVEAEKVKERSDVPADTSSATMPTVGLSIDRRVMAHVHEAYNDSAVKCLVCFVCAEKNLYHASFDRTLTSS
jgi:hypothetical protein